MKGLISTGFFIGIIVLLGKVSAFGKDVVVSGYYGASWESDAYFIAGNVPLLLFSAFLSSITVVVLPLYIEAKRRGEGNSFSKTALNFYLVFAFFLSVLGIIFAKQLVFIFAPFASHQVLDLAADLTRIFCVSFVFSSVVSIYSSLQYANGITIPSQLIPVLNNILVIVGAIFFIDVIGIYSIAVFAVFGWVFQVFFQRIFLPKDVLNGSFFIIDWIYVQRIRVLLAPVLIGVTVDQLNVFVDTILASGFDEGSVSSINYANRLVSFFSGFFSVFITAVVFPKLSGLSSCGQLDRLGKVVRTVSLVIFIICVPVSIICIWYNDLIVSTVFERGRFDLEDVKSTAKIFTYYSAGLFLLVFRDLMNRSFYALQDVKSPLLVSFITVSANVILSFYFIKSMGISGLAFATFLSLAICCSVQYLLLLRQLVSLFDASVLICLAKLVVPLSVFLFILWAFNAYFGVGNIFYLFTTSFLSLGIYAVIIVMLDIFDSKKILLHWFD